MSGRRPTESLFETQPDASSSSSSSQESSDPLLVCAPGKDGGHDEKPEKQHDSDNNDIDDDDDEGEDMYSAMEVMVRFQEDDQPNDDHKDAKENTPPLSIKNTSTATHYYQYIPKAVRVRLIQQKIRKWLDFYVQFLQASPMHRDRLLKALQWTTWLASAILEQQQPGNHSNPSNNNKKPFSYYSMALYKLSLDLSFARYATRLLELPAAVQAAWTGCWTATAVTTTTSTTTSTTGANSQYDPGFNLQNIYNWLGRGLAWSMVGYYPAEYAAYLLWMLPTHLQTTESNRQAAKFSAWSCRCWLVYLASDLVQSLLQWKEQQQQQQLQLQQQQRALGGEVNPHADMTKTTTALMTCAKLQSLRNALFLLPCIHWALPNWDTRPWLPIKVVNGLMWMEAIVSLYQSSLALPSSGGDDDAADQIHDLKKKKEN